MCCIFTCCGWMIDLIQRLWTFTMSCCISSAVCCLMVTGSMSGIALGYNYSLAEYIDLKETNVSVYLKRGVFDDEIADDMDWRRSGRMPVAGHIGTDNLITGAPAEMDSTPVQSGRRLDDSVFESDDPNKYEGSLMRLTAQPPYPGTTTGTTDGPEYVESGANFSPGSLDQLKAIQGMISARKSAMGTVKTQQKTTYADIDERYLAQLPPNPNQPPSGRRMMQPNMVDRLNPARLAVPPQNIGSKENWIYPKDPVKYRQRFSYSDIDYPDFNPQYPKPSHLPTVSIIRPPKPTPTPEMRTYKSEEEETSKPRIPLISIKPEINSALQNFKEKMMLQKFEAPEYPKKPKDSSDDYEEDVRGLPVRRKRSIGSVNNAKIFEGKEATEVSKINKNDSTLISFKITSHDEILKGNTSYEDVKKKNFTVSYRDTQTVSSQDTVEEAKTLVADEIEFTTTTSLLHHKLIGQLISKENSEDPEDDVTENITFSTKNTSNKIWTRLRDEPVREDILSKETESKDMMADGAKTLNTIGISVNDIKPLIMVRIFKSTVA